MSRKRESDSEQPDRESTGDRSRMHARKAPPNRDHRGMSYGKRHDEMPFPIPVYDRPHVRRCAERFDAQLLKIDPAFFDDVRMSLSARETLPSAEDASSIWRVYLYSTKIRPVNNNRIGRVLVLDEPIGRDRQNAQRHDEDGHDARRNLVLVDRLDESHYLSEALNFKRHLHVELRSNRPDSKPTFLPTTMTLLTEPRQLRKLRWGVSFTMNTIVRDLPCGENEDSYTSRFDPRKSGHIALRINQLMNILSPGETLPNTLVCTYLKQPGSHSWHSWYAIRLNPDLLALYLYLADAPVHSRSELAIHDSGHCTWV